MKKRLDDSQQRLSIRHGFAEVKAGHYIPHEAMKPWLLSLGTSHELPPPKCVCGEAHDGPKPRRYRGV
ncbi:MAG: hypothetical protein DMG21_21000 [Acidobacteria bacterium]|nr:MAG: hypothetical protein DMG21_21000 [Acidobacteriota bacterium]